jgi:hypothetical protein
MLQLHLLDTSPSPLCLMPHYARLSHTNKNIPQNILTPDISCTTWHPTSLSDWKATTMLYKSCSKIFQGVLLLRDQSI